MFAKLPKILKSCSSETIFPTLPDRLLDINSFVNEYLEQHPDQAHRFIANILGHTVVALTQWGCTGSPEIRNFMVVYNDHGIENMAPPVYDEEGMKVHGYTTFGDDVTTSDSLLSAEGGDAMVCLEGGAQSFCQVINILRRGVPVHLVYNLRFADINMFSASRFLLQIREALSKNPHITKDELRAINEEQIVAFGDMMFNKKKGDYKTKRQLYKQAIEGLIDEELFRKIPELCTFYDAKAS